MTVSCVRFDRLCPTERVVDAMPDVLVALSKIRLLVNLQQITLYNIISNIDGNTKNVYQSLTFV
jgi:hypothetical protein